MTYAAAYRDTQDNIIRRHRFWSASTEPADIVIDAHQRLGVVAVQITDATTGATVWREQMKEET